MENQHKEMIEEYLTIGRANFKTDFRLPFTRSYPNIAQFNREYRNSFFEFMEQLAEVGIEDATCDAEYDLMIVGEINILNSFKSVVPKIMIILFTDDLCRYVIEGTNTIYDHKFKNDDDMWC